MIFKFTNSIVLLIAIGFAVNGLYLEHHLGSSLEVLLANSQRTAAFLAFSCLLWGIECRMAMAERDEAKEELKKLRGE